MLESRDLVGAIKSCIVKRIPNHIITIILSQNTLLKGQRPGVCITSSGRVKTIKRLRVRIQNQAWGLGQLAQKKRATDHDVEAISTGFGLGSVSIGFEALSGAFEGLGFMVARVVTQDITVLARDASTGEIRSHTFYGSTSDDPVLDRTVEEFAVDLDDLFLADGASTIWSEIAVHNHGGMFGVDNIGFDAVVVVPGVAPGLAGMLGLAAMRRRRR